MSNADNDVVQKNDMSPDIVGAHGGTPLFDHTPLPEGWRWVKLGEVIKEAQPGFAIGERDPNGIIQFRMNNVDTRGRISWTEYIRVPATPDQIEKYSLLQGDVVFNNTNSTELVGKSAQFLGHNETVVYSNHFTRIRVKETQLDSNYLASWLLNQWQKKVFENLCNRWIGQSAVKNEKLLALSLPLPPLPDQKRIAAILNEKMAQIEKARKATEQQLETARALPAAYLRSVFTVGACCHTPLPEGWRWVRVGEVCDVVNGFGFAEYLQGRKELPYPFIKVSDMNADGAELIVTNAENTVDKNILKVLRAKTYPPGTVIFPKVGGALLTNKKRILGREGTFDNNIMGLVPKTVESKWLYFWMQTVDLAKLCNTQALPSIRQSTISELQLLLPPLPEQKRIAAILNEQMASAQKLSAHLEDQLSTINKLPAALLRKAFNGEL